MIEQFILNKKMSHIGIGNF